MKGRQHVLDNYSFEKFNSLWVETVDDIFAKHGSWETRKNYKSIRLSGYLKRLYEAGTRRSVQAT